MINSYDHDWEQVLMNSPIIPAQLRMSSALQCAGSTINKSNNRNTSLSLQSCPGGRRLVKVGALGRFAKGKRHYAEDSLNERELLGKVGAFLHNDKFAPEFQS